MCIYENLYVSTHQNYPEPLAVEFFSPPLVEVLAYVAIVQQVEEEEAGLQNYCCRGRRRPLRPRTSGGDCQYLTFLW